jgi:xylulokinase
MSLLGIDIGTGGCKAAAFSTDGQCLASAYGEYAPRRPAPDWVELDSAEVWQIVTDTVARVVAQTARDPITALCTSSMGEALACVTQDGRLFGRSITSADARGAEHVERLRAAFGAAGFYAINPNILGPNYSLPKLLWLREHAPAEFAAADKLLLWGDLPARLWGGESVASHSLANRTLLFDLRRRDWSEPLLAWSGVPRDKLGRCVPGGQVLGTVAPAAARTLGLPPGVKIVAGGHDQCCNALGAGLCGPGRAVCGIGSFECITPVYDRLPEPGPMLAQGLNIEDHVLDGLYVSFLYNQGGTLIRWFRDTFAATDRRVAPPGEDLYERLAAEMPDEPTGLLALPCFEMTGPPAFVADAAGALVGLKTSTTRGEILKCLMESETFYFADSLTALRAMGIDTSEMVATGGGAKSDRWLQIKADILGIPFVRPRITEGSVLGAAMLAGIATGLYASPREAVECFVQRDRVFEPDPERHQRYRVRLAHYRQLYPALRPLLQGLTGDRDGLAPQPAATSAPTPTVDLPRPRTTGTADGPATGASRGRPKVASRSRRTPSC